MFTSPDTQGYPMWLAVIHAVNEARPNTFGNPDGVGNVAQIDKGIPGRYIEDYPEALVVMPPDAVRFTDDATVLVVGKTPEVDAAIDAAAKLVTERWKAHAADRAMVADMERDGLL